MAARGGARPGAGRKPNVPDRATAAQRKSLEEVARSHTETAIKALAEIAKSSESDAARVSAANAILDRGYGKPRQSIQHGGGIDVNFDLSGLTDDELAQLEYLRGKVAPVGGDPSGAGTPGG